MDIFAEQVQIDELSVSAKNSERIARLTNSTINSAFLCFIDVLLYALTASPIFKAAA